VRLSKYKRMFETLTRKYELYNGGEKLFGLPEMKYPELTSTVTLSCLSPVSLTSYLPLLPLWPLWPLLPLLSLLSLRPVAFLAYLASYLSFLFTLLCSSSHHTYLC
jgi:hypothetical protein